ncbi:MAG: hypothetical protein WBM90_12650 [Acidimicrobiia bacterium]
MDLGEALLVLHIAAAGTWLGANVMQAVVPPMMARQSAEAAAGWYRTAAGLSKKLYMPAAILLLITGIWMVVRIDAYSFGSLFVTIGFVMIVVGAILGIVIFGPGSEAAADAVESGDPGRIKAAASKLATWGTVDTLLLLFTITAMVIRWS